MALEPKLKSMAAKTSAPISDGDKPKETAVPTSKASISTRVGSTAAVSLPQTTGQPASGTLLSSHSDSPSRPNDCRARLPLNITVYMINTAIREAREDWSLANKC